MNMFIIMMMILSMMALMINNLIYLWIFLEINLLIFIFSLNQSMKNSSITPIFFISQSFPSLLMLWLILSNFNFLNKNLYILFFIILMLKLGFFPFTWIPPYFLKNFDWNMLFMFSTFQKFIPLLMLKNSFKHSFLPIFFVVCLLTLIFSSIKAIISSNLKSILAFSSINNTCWMSLMMIFDFNLFLNYFSIYFILMLTFTKFMGYLNLQSFKKIMYLSFHKNLIKLQMYSFFLLISLSMIPPTIFFIIKFMTLLSMNLNNFQMFMTCFMMCSTLSILMYTNIFIKMFFFTKIKPKFSYNLKSYKTFSIPIIIFIFPSFIFLQMFLY